MTPTAILAACDQWTGLAELRERFGLKGEAARRAVKQLVKSGQFESRGGWDRQFQVRRKDRQ